MKRSLVIICVVFALACSTQSKAQTVQATRQEPDLSWTDALTDSTELIGSFDSGWILAKENGRYFYINEKGRKYVEGYYDNVATFKDAKPVSYGFDVIPTGENGRIIKLADSVDLTKTDFSEIDPPKNCGYALVKRFTYGSEWEILDIVDEHDGGRIDDFIKNTGEPYNGVTPFSQEIFYRSPTILRTSGYSSGRTIYGRRYTYHGLLDSLGNVLGNYRYWFFRVERDGGTEISSKPLFENGLTMVAKIPPDETNYIGRSENEIGLMDNTGAIVTDSLYSWIGPFHSDLAVMSYYIERDPNDWSQLHGYIDRNGKTVIAPQYRDAKSFEGDFAFVGRTLHDWAIINKRGEVLADNFHRREECNDSVWRIENNFRTRQQGYGDYAYVSRQTGKRISNFYDQLGCPCKLGLPLPVRLGPFRKPKWGYVAPNGEEILPIEYDGVSFFDPEYRVAWIRLRNKTALIDTKGQEVIPGWYSYIGDISPDSTVLVKRDGRYAVINIATGEVTNGWSRKKPIARYTQKDE